MKKLRGRTIKPTKTTKDTEPPKRHFELTITLTLSLRYSTPIIE